MVTIEEAQEAMAIHVSGIFYHRWKDSTFLLPILQQRHQTKIQGKQDEFIKKGF